MNTSIIISKSFRVIKYLNKSIKDLYDRYYRQKDIYYSNLNYYKKFGGLYPTNTFRDTLREIDDLKEIKKYVLENIDEIKFTKKYTFEFKEYIESLLYLMI